MSLFGKKHTDDQDDFTPYGDNFIPLIPVDYTLHTEENPFCNDLSCPCHEDQSKVGKLNNYYQDGLVSAEDADRIFRGKAL